MPTWIAIWIALVLTLLLIFFVIYMNWRVTEARNWKQWIEWDVRHRDVALKVMEEKWDG